MLQNAILKALRNAKRPGEDEGGFTLIELLVVILIIGILAAIALPTFLGQSDKAKDSSAKSNARNAVTQMESCLADATGSTTAAVNSCKTNEQVLGNGDSRIAFDSGVASPAYKIDATSKTSTVFSITKSGDAPGAYNRTCSPTGSGGCNAGGSW